MTREIFRKAALEKLSTPEKLDQLIRITSLKSWMILLTIGLVIGTTMGWSIIGRIKTKLNATGVLLGGKVYNVVSNTRGQLIHLEVSLGDTVSRGDVIAIVEQPTLLQRIEDTQASLQERKFELDQLLAFGFQDTRLQGEFVQQKRISLQQQIQSNDKNLDFLKQQLKVEKELYDKGLITQPQVVATEQQIENTQNQIENLKAELVQTKTQELNVDFDLEQKITVNKQRIAQEERKLKQLEEQYNVDTQVKSLHSGQVVEILTNSGVIVSLGTPLCKLKSGDIVENDLRGILYVSSQDGKKIKVGMDALVVPVTVQPQEFGYIKGTVTYVSEFPVTQQGMMISMKNDQLVQSLLTLGAPFEIMVDFKKDSNSYSGFQWTSAKGPEITVNAGTSCAGKITVREEPPIAMVIPALKGFFDLY